MTVNGLINFNLTIRKNNQLIYYLLHIKYKYFHKIYIPNLILLIIKYAM